MSAPARCAAAPADPADAVSVAFLAISTSAISTQATVQLVRMLADEFGCGTLDLAADRLEGVASRTGPHGVDDATALAKVAALEQAFGAGAVAAVARTMAPGDRAAQESIGRRLRRKRAAS
jgi:hypothetical protein